ncbi:MAG: MtnX-like HAD-IB family phosphatase [Armatimonadetes bacterium]|nr:MtnX-like HAD-IB family phosphatase [Armatimonadota bacterium]
MESRGITEQVAVTLPGNPSVVGPWPLCYNRPMACTQLRPLGADDLVVSDFDGTISVVDTSLAVIEALRLDAAWDAEMVWRRGEISSMECLRRQWGLVQLPEDRLYSLLDSLEVDPDFLAFLAFIRERGAGLVVLSDGLDFYIDRMLDDLGLQTTTDDAHLRGCGPVLRFANRATVTPQGIEVDFPYANFCGQCGNCKTEHFFRLRRGFRRTIYLGDGHSDLCVARFADVVFAKDALAEDCARCGRTCYPFHGLADVMQALGAPSHS